MNCLLANNGIEWSKLWMLWPKTWMCWMIHGTAGYIIAYYSYFVIRRDVPLPQLSTVDSFLRFRVAIHLSDHFCLLLLFQLSKSHRCLLLFLRHGCHQRGYHRRSYFRFSNVLPWIFLLFVNDPTYWRGYFAFLSSSRRRFLLLYNLFLFFFFRSGHFSGFFRYTTCFILLRRFA